MRARHDNPKQLSYMYGSMDGGGKRVTRARVGSYNGENDVLVE
jgi:hypothetical protein